jgi:hypothetical protein
MTLNLSEISSKMASEFLGNSLYNMIILVYLFSLQHNVDYYINTFFSALTFSVMAPIFLALIFYFYYLFDNKRIDKKYFFVSLLTLAVISYLMYLYVRYDIYDIDHYECFFINYIQYLIILITSWIVLWLITNYLKKKGSKRPRWEGEIPYHKLELFYKHILLKYASREGSRLSIKMEIPGGASNNEIDEMKSALKELGLEKNLEI